MKLDIYYRQLIISRRPDPKNMLYKLLKPLKSVLQILKFDYFFDKNINLFVSYAHI